MYTFSLFPYLDVEAHSLKAVRAALLFKSGVGNLIALAGRITNLKKTSVARKNFC